MSLSGKLPAEPKRTDFRARRVFDDIVAPPLPLVRGVGGGKVSHKPLGRLGRLGLQDDLLDHRICYVAGPWSPWCRSVPSSSPVWFCYRLFEVRFCPLLFRHSSHTRSSRHARSCLASTPSQALGVVPMHVAGLCSLQNDLFFQTIYAPWIRTASPSIFMYGLVTAHHSFLVLPHVFRFLA